MTIKKSLCDIDGDEAIAQKYIAEQLLVLRKKSKKSQDYFAEKFGVSLSTYKRWEECGPKNYPLRFWQVYAEVSSEAGREVKNEYGKQIMDAIGFLVKSIVRD